MNVPWRRYKLKEMEPRKTGIGRDRRERNSGEYKIDKIMNIPAVAPIVLSVSPNISASEIRGGKIPPSVVI